MRDRKVQLLTALESSTGLPRELLGIVYAYVGCIPFGRSVTLQGHTGYVRCLTVLPDGRVVSRSDDKTLRV